MDLHGQDLTARLDDTDRIAAGKPGQEGAKNIKYSAFLTQIATDLNVSIARTSLSSITSTITIDEQSDSDYEIEVVKYTTDEGADGKSIVTISNKTTTSFQVDTVSGYESGVLIYRILTFS